jgi:hypothetical protein
VVDEYDEQTAEDSEEERRPSDVVLRYNCKDPAAKVADPRLSRSLHFRPAAAANRAEADLGGLRTCLRSEMLPNVAARCSRVGGRLL